MKIGAVKLGFVALIVASFLFLVWIATSQQESSKPVLFFAYGANADRATMASRAGGFESVQPARLRDYRLSFQTNKNTDFGVANAIPEQGAEVAGALYVLTRAQIGALDKNANVPKFYEKKSVSVVGTDGKSYDAFAYFLSGDAYFAVPSRPYLNATLSGLQALGFGQNELDGVAAAAEEAVRKGSRGG
ncbi:MAG: gamma-glutamylcyclotransferase family protein [Candidatus Anstonellaceae archaeon]